MATVIAKTPVLKNKEADRFRRNADKNRNRCAPLKEIQRVVHVFISVLKKHDNRFIEELGGGI